MWIAGLGALQKPFLHLHTQFNQEIPWSSIDMDFMNLNQAAHGDREFGFIAARLRLERTVVVGHWTDRRGPGPDRGLDPRGQRPPRLGDRPDRPVRRQHARGRGHRGRQGRSAAAARVRHQHATASATWSRASTTPPTPTSTGSSRRTSTSTRSSRSCGPAAIGTGRCATAPGSSSGCGRSWATGGSSPSPIRSRTSMA